MLIEARKLDTNTATNTPFTRPSWLDELVRRAGYMLAGQASSMFARRLLDVCSMFVCSCKRSIKDAV